MIIESALFVKSATTPEGCPPPELPEVAFAGRSNVGKSSLINTLVNRKRLVKTSSTPGRTQLLNFFRINDRILFVDLPGYGYAKVPESVRRSWGPMVENYLSSRSSLRLVVLVLDIRRTPAVEELDLLAWLQKRGLPVVPVLTKSDKLSGNGKRVRRRIVAEALGLEPERPILFSAKTRAGRDSLWKEILSLTQGAAP